MSQLDHVLLSPALALKTRKAAVHVERRGLGFARYLQNGKPGPAQTSFQRTEDDPAPLALDFQFKRLAGVTPDACASDHCPVFFEVP